MTQAKISADIASIVANSEEVGGPLDDLMTRFKDNPGAPFEFGTLAAIIGLRSCDRPAFEALRAKLKRAGCRVTALDDAIAREGAEGVGRGTKQADILIDLAQSADLFHAPDGSGFADFVVDEHRETWSIRGKGFRRWLARRFFNEVGGAPNSEAMRSALNVIEARADYDAPERAVHVRVGGVGDKLYLDLADDNWRAVEIDANGWRVIDNPPVRFRRAPGMLPLPTPQRGRHIEILRPFLNVRSDADFVLVIAWTVAAFRNRGPYPLLALAGEQGTAKSTFSSMLRSLIDPNLAPLRALPREDRDLFIAATNGHLMVFDNVSGLPAWISDTLCRLATGGGFAVRRLYSDQDEVLFDAARPTILNGIEDIVTRPDLADRAIFLILEPIPEEQRRPEAELWAAFEQERPYILGALLDAVAAGLKHLSQTRLPKLPRMADFALWAVACETALWPAGTFWAAYRRNLDEAAETVLEADPVAAAVRTLMATRTEWSGIAASLLRVLEEIVGERAARSKTWPVSARSLGGQLRRLAPGLRKIGVKVAFERKGHGRNRTISITATLRPDADSEGFRPSASSAPSAATARSNDLSSLVEPAPRTIAKDADGHVDAREGTVRGNAWIIKEADGADGADANRPPHSAAAERNEAPRIPSLATAESPQMARAADVANNPARPPLRRTRI